MISRTYTVDQGICGQPEPFEIVGTYKGFDKRLTEALFVAVIQFDGDYDTWALDDLNTAVAELKRYYQETYGRLPEKMVLYSQAKQ